jgi:hypothetical protein
MIHVTAIVPPAQGLPIAMYCPICKETTFMLSPWAIKPERGDYWVINDQCASEENSYRHNIQMAMKVPQRMMFGPYDTEFTQEIPLSEAKNRYPEMFYEPGE